MKQSKQNIVRQFGRQADAYAQSPDHARGPDLDLLLRLLEPRPEMTVLDVATGPGHTAATIAPHVGELAAIDLSPEMVSRANALFAARGLSNAVARVMDVEMMEFPSYSFDAVTCRVAPHHFPDIRRAIREIARVLRPGACFVLEDSCSPDDPILDRFLNDVERLRDPTHVRSYTKQEWLSMLDHAGLSSVHDEIYRKPHDIGGWLRMAGAPGDVREKVYASFSDATPEAHAHFEVVFESGRAVSFTDDKLILRAEKRSP